MRYCIREFVFIFISLALRIRNSGLKMGFRAKSPFSSVFEGNNKLGAHSFFSGELGYASYVGADSIVIGKVGRYSSIADKVVFLTKTHPTKEFVTTHPCFYSLKKQSGFTYTSKQLFNEEPRLTDSNYSIEIGNDVYIGYGATIIGPCRIGNGAIIAAGAVVTGDIPNYAVAGGVPAKVIKYRFSNEEISFLERFQWWDKSQEWLSEHVEAFQNIKDFIQLTK